MDEERTGRMAYPIKRNFKASMRLNYNHLLMKEVAGYLLSPTIPVPRSSLRIADVGTGTAAWALEVASKHPSAQIDGFDISDEQFPPLFNIANVRLHVHDCFKPFPEVLRGQYDIVHARFWLCLVNDPDAAVLLKNLMTLLKPGGYLQWMEPLALDVCVHKSDPALQTPALDQHVRVWKKPRESTTYGWVAALPALFEKHSLSLVAVNKHPVPDSLRAVWGISNVAGYEDWADATVHGVERAEGMQQLMEGMQHEMRKGAGLGTDFICVVGKMPA